MSRTNYIEERPAVSGIGWRSILAPLAALALLAAGLWNLSGPPMWWDEGWTLSVARTWVERGHYGRLLTGQLATNGLEASLPITGTVALAFRLFGVGVWQGRLPGVIAMVAAIVLLYILATRLYDRRVAVGTMFLLLLTPMHPQLNPLIMGRQVLGEMHMFCFLLGGYLCLLLALSRSRWWILPASLCWGLAIISKAQTLPFWAISLTAPLAVALGRRHWSEAGLLGLGLAGGYAMARFALLPLIELIVRSQQVSGAVSLGAVQDLYGVTAVVLTAFNRSYALQLVLLAGLPVLFGLCHGAWQVWRSIWRPAAPPSEAARETLRLALLGLAGSWFAWFLLLSVGVPRYLFPATYFGTVFFAALLQDLTDGFNLFATLSRGGSAIRRLRLGWRSAGALATILFFIMTVPITMITLTSNYLNNTDRSAAQVAAFLNTQTPPNALIETYESELHFLLNRPYHYPPDQTHVQLNHRSLLHESVTIDYDPLAAQPDYLVVGRFARENKLYQPTIDSGAFRLLKHDGLYDIYERAR
jgi:hypothetical protein